MSGPAGLGAAPDAPGKLPPQGPGALRPERVHPGESRAGAHETTAGGAHDATESVAAGGRSAGRGRRKEREDGVPAVNRLGQGAIRLGAWAGQHSWEKQPSGQHRNRWSR